MMPILSYLYWDPVREMFTLPFVERPVMWYGFFFVMGLVIGYFIIISVFQKKLSQTPHLLMRDVSNWNVLVRQLRLANQEDIGKLTQLEKTFPKELLSKLKNQSIPESFKIKILEELNQYSIERKEWEKMFPKAFYSLKELSAYLADKLLWCLLGGILIGARLGHVFFYEWPWFAAHPLDIIKIWEGGLASHGGTIGILISVALYIHWMGRHFPELKFITVVDALAVPTGLAACLIRIGNFVNQEIIGIPTTLPWAVVFAHPADGGAAVPRHPTQLYESIAYLFTFIFLYTLWRKKGDTLRQGTISGLFFILTFGSRFFIEFTKKPLSSMIDENFLQTGQYLSIPFILLGLFLLLNPVEPVKETASNLSA